MKPIKITNRKITVLVIILGVVVLASVFTSMKNEKEEISVENIWENVDITGDLYSFIEPGLGSIGIDVSEHQKEIDWKKVKQSGVEFAIIRLGYRGYESGDIFLDQKFEYNASQAKELDLLFGVYFFSQAITEKEAIEEANFVIKNLKGYGKDLVVAFDMEKVTQSDRILKINSEQRTKIAHAFLQTVKDAGYQPVFYSNQHWLNELIFYNELSEYPLWYAYYYTEVNRDDMWIWQYSESGRLDGISTDVDLNFRINQ